MPALAREVEVELAERRQERVRVVELVHLAAGIRDLEPVAERERRLRDGALEDARRVAQLERDRVAALDEDAHAVGVRAVGADDHAAVLRVRAEDVVRVGVLPPDDALELLGDGHGLISSSSSSSGGGRRATSACITCAFPGSSRT